MSVVFTSVGMAMMNVGIMWVRMLKPVMPVRMRVRFSDWIVRGVFMLMMCIVRMFVLMRHWFMNVEVLVTFSHVQPHSNGD
jgi:hypothetical protein